MKRALLLLGLAACMAAGADERVWYFGALLYGPEQWSLIKVTNTSDAVRSASLEIYEQNGRRLPSSQELQLQPGESREVRVEAAVAETRLGWARITASAKDSKALKIEAAVEKLSGNAIDRVSRQELRLSLSSNWYTETKTFEFLYIANTRGEVSKVTLCWADRPRRGICDDKENIRNGGVNRLTLQPRQTLYAGLGKRRGKYLVFQVEQPAEHLITFLAPAKATRREFATDSVLDFENVDEK
jgi:hypothetical protein